MADNVKERLARGYVVVDDNGYYLQRNDYHATWRFATIEAAYSTPVTEAMGRYLVSQHGGKLIQDPSFKPRGTYRPGGDRLTDDQIERLR